MNTLQYCVVKELETCEESTPANLVESMFKFVRNETPCANMTVSFFYIFIRSFCGHFLPLLKITIELLVLRHKFEVLLLECD